MKMPKIDIPNAQNDRKKRLADALRQNLQLRKARVRASDASATPSDEAKSKAKADKA